MITGGTAGDGWHASEPDVRPPSVKWKEIADAILQEIVTRNLPIGSKLEVEGVLAEKYGVNRHTVRRAVASLAELGLVSVEQGRGTFVSSGIVNYPVGPRTRFTEIVTKQSREPAARLLDVSEVAAKGQIAEDLSLREGTSLIVLHTIQFVDGIPINLVAHHFERARFPGIDEVYRSLESVTKSLQAYGVTAYSRKTTRVSARLPRPEEAHALRQGRSKPVLVMEAINIDRAGAPIEVGISVSAAERFRVIFEQ